MLPSTPRRERSYSPHRDPALANLLRNVCAQLQDHYAERLEEVVLHGSVARGTDEPESDIDLLVLLRGDFDYFRELRALVDRLYPLQLDAERVIAALPAAADDYRAGTLQLYRNAVHEGVDLSHLLPAPFEHQAPLGEHTDEAVGSNQME